jgi:hypothetical protein
MSSKTVKRNIVISINGKEVTNSLAGVGKEIGILKRDLRKLVPGTQEFVDKSKELRKAKKAYKDINDEIRDTNVSLEDAQGHFANLFGGIVSGNFKMVQEGLRGITSNIKGMTKAAISFIATPLGAAIAVLSGIALAAKQWVDFNLEVEKSNQLIRDITQESELAVNAIRIRAEVLKDTFDVELKDSVTTAKSLVDNLGISFDEAFDIIEDGAIRGKLKNDEFLESLKEYPVQFKNADFSAQEFARIINTGIDLSIYKDKLPDAIKEFTLSVTEQTTAAKDAMINAFGKEFTDSLFQDIKSGAKTPKEALQSIALEAERIGLNSQQAQLLTADLFKGAGEDAGGALKVFEAVNVALNEEVKPLTEIQELQKEQLEVNKELKGVYTQLFATADGGFGKLIAKGKLFASQILLNILKRGVDVYNWFVDLKNESGTFSALITVFEKSFTGTFKTIGIILRAAVTSFKGFGDVLEGVFTFDFDKIKQGVERSFSAIPQMISEIKETAKQDAQEIFDAFSGKNQSQRINLDNLLSGESGSTTNTTTTTTSNEEGLTPQDSRILASKKKLAQFLKDFEEEQELQRQLKEYEDAAREEQEEVLRLEAKYQKMAEDAGYETISAAGLEEAHQAALQEIRNKYADIKQKKQDEANKKFAEADKKQKQRLIDAELKLEQAKANALYTGLGVLKGVVNQRSGIYTALFAFEKALAINDIIVNSAKSIAQSKAALAIANAKAVAAAPPWMGGFPWVGINTAIVGKEILTTKLTAATQIAAIVATALKGFKSGGYTGEGEATEIAGIQHKDEYVVPSFIVQDPTYAPIINQIEERRTQNTGENNTLPTQIQDTQTQDNNLLTAAIMQLVNKLEEPIIANALIGDNQIQDFNNRSNTLTKARSNAKIK